VLYRVAFKSANLLMVSLVTSAAMLAICLLALVETPNTAKATSLPQNGKIAFSRYQREAGYDIYTVDPDGSNLSRLISDSDEGAQPAWSPDGTQIAFGSGPIWVMGADGSNLRMLTPNRSVDNLSLGSTWSPDGEQLAFASAESPKSSITDIYTMDVDSSNKTNITNSPGVNDLYFDLSPDGSKMCLHRFGEPEKGGENYVEGGIYVMRVGSVDASNPSRLTDYHGIECAWSPDGRKIAYSYEQPEQLGVTKQDADVYVMNSDGSGKTNLTNNQNWDVKPNRKWEGAPQWSPDGKRIAFTSNRDGNLDLSYNSDVYTMDADGSDVVRVTKTPDLDESNPDWQPLTPKSRNLTVHPPDTGGPSLLLVASALLFSGGVLFYAGLKRRM
jgi:TolB protein